MTLTKHSVDRAVERLVDISTRKLNKKQKLKARLNAKKIMKADLKDQFAYYNISEFERHVYSQLDTNNSCVKFITGFNGNVVTVVKTNFYKELKNNRLIRFIQKYPEECYAIGENIKFLFIYTYPIDKMSLKYKIIKESGIIVEKYYVDIEKEKSLHDLRMVEDILVNRLNSNYEASIYLDYGIQVKLDYIKDKNVAINIFKHNKIDWVIEA